MLRTVDRAMSGTSHRKLCWKEPTAWAKSILVSQTAEAIDPRMRLAIRPMRTKDWTFPQRDYSMQAPY